MKPAKNDRTVVSDSDSSTSSSMPVMLAVVGTSIAWGMFLTSNGYQYFSPSWNSWRLAIPTLVFDAAGFVCCLVIVHLLKRGAVLRFWPMIVGALLFIVGNISVKIFGLDGIAFPDYASYVGASIQGAGSVLFILMWLLTCLELFSDTFGKILSYSVFGGMVIVVALLTLSNTSVNFLWPYISIPIVGLSLVCFWWLKTRKHKTMGDFELIPVITNPYLVPSGLEICIALTGFALAFAFPWFPIYSLENELPLTAAALSTLSVAVLFLAFRHNSPKRYLNAAKLSVLAVSVGSWLLLVDALPLLALSRVLVAIGGIWAIWSFMTLLGNVSEASNSERLYIFAIGFAFLLAGKVVAEAMGSTLVFSGYTELNAPSIAYTILAIVAAALSVTAAFCLEKIFSTKNYESTGQSLSVMDACSEIAQLHDLTSRQNEVLMLLVQGKKTKDIERELGISNGTARAHVRAVYEKCGVHSLSQLMAVVLSKLEQRA